MVQIPRLREWREARALTQVELAERAGVSSRSVAGYEAGAGARPPTVRKLASALGVEVAELRGDAEHPLGEAPPSSTQPPLNGFEEEQRREDRRAAALRDALEDLRLTAERYERYHTAQEKLDEFRAGWEKRLAEEDFDEAAVKEAGRTIDAFWPAVTALADSEMVGLMQSGYQLEEAAAQSALVPAIERFQALCDRVNSMYRKKFQNTSASIYVFPQRKAS
jgi:transcriptional regulator with XRE-family HTH domain